MTHHSKPLRLDLLQGELAVCRLEPDSPLPTPPPSAPLWVLACTADEVSLVCAAEDAPASSRHVSQWRCLKVAGPFDFDVIGVLASLTASLAEAAVSVFAVSTFDTDYLLVREPQLERAIAALTAAGHSVN